jgi:hypothetical protein
MQKGSLHVADPVYVPPLPSSHSEWVSAVQNVIPHLDRDGVRKALEILDAAMQLAQHAKTLDQVLADMPESAVEPGGSSNLQLWCNVNSARAQVSEKQRQLLGDLHRLRFGAGGNGLAPVAATDKGCRQEAVFLDQMIPNTLAAEKGCGAPGLPMSPQVRAQQQPGGAGSPGGKAASKRDGGNNNRIQESTNVQTLSTSLQLLSDVDPSHLFIVRRINKLGFKAIRMLKKSYSAYGTVVRVLLAHSTVKQHGENSARRRPSSLGFVQMDSAEVVAAILAFGEEQNVDGRLIRVQKFERQTDEECDDEGNECNEPFGCLKEAGCVVGQLDASSSLNDNLILLRQASSDDSPAPSLSAVSALTASTCASTPSSRLNTPVISSRRLDRQWSNGSTYSRTSDH